MRLFYTIIFLLCFVQINLAQNKELLTVAPYELAGKWTGELTQEGKYRIAPTYVFELTLDVTNNKITGHSYITSGANIDEISLKGRLNGLKVEITEIKIVDKEIKKDYFWCIKNLHLEFGFHNGRYRLKGKWDGASTQGACSPGLIEVFKETIRA